MKVTPPVGVLVSVLVLLGGGSAQAAAFSDPPGDQRDATALSLAGPDITGVEITNTTGAVTFRIAVGNYDSAPAGSTIGVVLDLDRDLTTGESGFETTLTHRVDQAGQARLVLERFDDAEFRYLEVPGVALAGGFSAGSLTLTVARSELAGTRGFSFGAFAALLDAKGRPIAGDVAPNEGRWSYALVGLPPLRLRGQALVATPGRPLAGRQFAVASRIFVQDPGATVTRASVACAARVGTTRLPAHGAFRDEVARCTMAVPRTAKGKRLTGTLTVRSSGATLTKRFSFQVG